MAAKWYKVGKGLQARDHNERKYGKRFDRYIRGRYMVDGKFRIIPFGWESEFAVVEHARVKKEGGLRQSFIDHCIEELATLKKNAKQGKGPTTKKEEKAEAEAERKTEEQARQEEEKQALTFSQYFEKTYYPAAAVSKKHNTWKQEGSYYRVWLKPNIGRIRLVDIRPLHVKKILSAMNKAEKAPRTIQAVLALARQVWNYARSNDDVSGDWPGNTKACRAPKFDNRRMRFLTHDECESLISKLREVSPQVADMALLSLDTGLRAGEIFSLLWENVDMTAGQIRVVDAKAGNRVAYMTERVKSMLQALPGDGGFVFPSKTGGRIGQISKTVERVISSLGLNAGITDPRNKATFHSLRHTFASRLVENGTDLYTVKELLGHSTLAMTERYSHVSNQSLQSAVKRMEKATAEKQRADVIPLQVNGKE